MKSTLVDTVATPLAAAVGAFLLSQSLSFGWLRAAQAPACVINVHSTTIAAAGVALLLLGVIARHLSLRIANLEHRVASLRRGDD
jgi:hypothetical protein